MKKLQISNQTMGYIYLNETCNPVRQYVKKMSG